MFVRPGIGLTVAGAEVTSGNVTVTATSEDVGLSVVGAAGYEFRLGKFFALSPEVNHGFARVDGVNVNKFGGQVGLMFSF